MNKISAVYRIVNTITGDCYVGSSRNVMHRWAYHKCPSTWNRLPNNPLYLDMQKYGVDKFRFQILAPVMSEYLRQVEQEFIDMLHPTYNDRRANVLDIGEYMNYYQSEKGKETNRKAVKKYYDQLCSYNGETLTLNTLRSRFYKAGIKHPCLEAKKYLLK